MRRNAYMADKPTISGATEEQIRDAFRKIKKQLQPRACKLCSEMFKPKRHWQTFCQETCRVTWFRLAKAAEEADWRAAKPKKSDLLE